MSTNDDERQARLAKIRAKHVLDDFGMVNPATGRYEQRTSCKGCHRPWPCEQSVLLCELEAATARAERAEAAMRSVMAWAEDRGYLDPGGHEDDGPSDDLWAAMFAALRTYRAALAEGA